MTNSHSRPIRAYYGESFQFLNKKRNKLEKLWPFGPLGWEIHGDKGLGYKQNAAMQALDMVVDKSGTKRENLFDELRYIVPEARNAYPDNLLENLDDDRVIMKLAAESCLFLLVVFSILDAKLGFPDQHIIFGTGCVREEMEKWLRSIFFVGNQIPFVWVHKLMNSLKYFKDLEKQISKREQPPVELLKRTLFEFVTHSRGPKPVDVMQCLRSIILGPPQNRVHIWMVGTSDAQNIMKPQLSASALSKLGYIFKPLPQKSGYRGIKCEHSKGMVVVYLPVIQVVDYWCLELMVRSVEQLEYVHKNPETEYHPESTWFFNLLHNLIRKQDDVQVLNSQGVIGGRKLECVPDILSHFYEMPQYDSKLCLRKEIQIYRPRLRPYWKFHWCIISNIASINLLMTFILASLQTGYTIAGSYYQPKH